eukprot:Em0021g362a
MKSLASLSSHLEVGSGWGQESSRTRPADILVTDWENGISAAFDVTFASLLNSSTITEAGMYSVLAVLWVAPVASEETLDTQEGGAAVSQGLQTGSQAVGRGRAVSRGAHTGSQAVGRGRAVSRGAHTGSQAVGRGRAVSRGAYTGSQVVGRGRATRGRDQVRAQRHIATVEELLNEREENIDEDKSDIEIEENPLSPHREDVTHAFVHDVGWKKNPTPNGREAHTTVDADTGCIINYEIYEGKTLMADKKHVRDLVQWEALAALDKDKQPMFLIGTAGTTNMGKTLVRNFTDIRILQKADANLGTVIEWLESGINSAVSTKFNLVTPVPVNPVRLFTGQKEVDKWCADCFVCNSKKVTCEEQSTFADQLCSRMTIAKIAMSIIGLLPVIPPDNQYTLVISQSGRKHSPSWTRKQAQLSEELL